MCKYNFAYFLKTKIIRCTLYRELEKDACTYLFFDRTQINKCMLIRNV